MRTIKFRGKSKKDGEWFYGNFYDKDVSGNTHIMTTKRGCLDVDPETVGQFTGLRDINGNEIYESDILKVTCFINRPTIEERIEYMGEVYFSLSNNIVGWRIKIVVETGIHNEWIGLNTVHKNRVVVVGNVYDNPELLKNNK